MFHSELMNSASPSALDNPAASRATPARSGESGDGDFSAILAAARATGEAGPALNRAAGRAAPAQGETQSAEEGASQNADLTIEAGLTSNGAAQSPAPADPRMATPTPGQVAAPLSGAPAPRMADPTPANQTGPITPIPVSDPETGMPGVPRASNPNPGESAAPQPTGQTPVLAGEPSMSGPNPGETAAPQPTGQTPVLAGEPSMSGPNPGETAAPQPTGQTPVLAGEPTMSGPNPGESAAPQPTGQTPVLAGEPAMSGPNPGESVRPQTANPVAATPTPVQVVGGSATTGANPAPNSGGNTAAGTPVAANAAMPAADPLRPMRGEAPAGLTTGIAAKPGANAKPGAAKPGMTAGASAIESGAKASMGGETAAPERPASQPPGPTVGQNSGPNMLPNAASPALAANTPLQPLGDEAGRAALQGEADAVIEMERAARADAARPGAAAPGQQAAHRLPQTTLPHLAAQISKRFSAGQRVFEIRMDPPEMGRVDVKLELNADQRVQAVLTVERQDTLNELQRAARELERALAEAGLQLGENGLSFELGGQNAEGDDAGGSDSGPSFDIFAEGDEAAADGLPLASHDAYGFALSGRTGVNITV